MTGPASPYPPCLDCAGQPTERLIEMFVQMGQAKRIRLGQRPTERPVFRKLHGVAHGRLEPLPGLAADLKAGFLAHGDLAAWIRFSSDTAPTDPDLESTTGIGIKLFGVPGRNALGEDGATADLILQNHPVFFVDDATTMCEFTYAGTVLGDYPGYLAQHPRTREILAAMQTVEGSVLTATYWGILPFRLGSRIVKYRLDPETPPQNVPNDATDYLATDLAGRLAKAEYRFRLMIQERTDPATMPLDQATVDWPEASSPFVQVATLVLPKQDVGARGQAEYGQGLAFNIWRVPDENAPVPESSIAAVRRAVYAASADLRHGANGQPIADPPIPRVIAPPSPTGDACIVGAVIHPAIGVARVGTSPGEWFIGPEVPDAEPLPPGSYRDAHGALKRQAARFRLYGVNMKGEIVRELTGADADVAITWTVRLANTKAAWYDFQLALDIPEASSAPPTTLRNPGITDRRMLAITPDPHSVSGRDAAPKAFDGAFMGKPVYLGEIRTDEAGRLIVLGGHGKSASYDGSWAVTFANNEGWHDDVSDGPVTATVRIAGHPVPVTPAWVVVAPPNYGPQRKSVRTMWDLMRDVAITAGTLPRPAQPSFTHDILPIFRRMAGLQWVNAGFAAGFGWKGMFDFDTPEGIARLADDGPAGAEFRKVIANQFRRYTIDSWSPVPWPWIYGDAMNVPPAQTPRQHAVLTDTQLGFLDQWAMGRFRADYDPAAEPATTIEAVPLAEQGDTLTRAALEFCLADAFHPGCEMTWPVRAASLYMAPFRIAHAGKDWVPPSPGEVLTGDAISIPNGPLAGQYPGGLTQWMALPWQTDTASCRSGYTKTYDPYVPTFWPARVPNQVMTKANYAIVRDTEKPMGERLAAFANRAAWIEPLGSTSYTDQINNMIAHFDRLGVVEVHPGPKDGAFPASIEVEDQHKPIHDVIPKPHPAEGMVAGHSRAPAINGAPTVARMVDLSTIEKVRRFPHGLGG